MTVAAAVQALGSRLSGADKQARGAQAGGIVALRPESADVEVSLAVVVCGGLLAREATERSERCAADQDAFIEIADRVRGGRLVIKGSGLTGSPSTDGSYQAIGSWSPRTPAISSLAPTIDLHPSLIILPSLARDEAERLIDLVIVPSQQDRRPATAGLARQLRPVDLREWEYQD